MSETADDRGRRVQGRDQRQHAGGDRSVWVCPNGHENWKRPTTEQLAEQGDHVWLECASCHAAWKATPAQRAVLIQHARKQENGMKTPG